VHLLSLLIVVELLDAELRALGLVEVLVDHGGLRLAEADKIYHVGEDFYEALVGGFVEVLEGEVVDSALWLSVAVH